MKALVKALSIAVSVSFTLPALALDPIKPPAPPLLEKLQAEGAKLHNSFSVSEHLNGFAMTIGSDQVIVYATKDGKLLFNGALMDNNSKDLTSGFEKKYLPKPDLSDALGKLESSSGFSTHDEQATKTLYVLHDPNCPYCKKAFNQIQLASSKPGIKVKWIPVAALGKSSAEKSAAMLASDDPVQLQIDFDNGYLPSQSELKEGTKHMQSVIDNTKLLKLIGATGTPAFVLADTAKGETLDVIYGYHPAKIERTWP